ncbi:DegV family protein [Granulicatella seriolae]|jgi:DegV family protein with EDD domain|uniref:DegV family protein n=1 Tax=Granulicatella seriolae TaxID=2967226 RepID=A0ABT1WL95_9LACT|nr:DegV family protein [Granulicatella seriolae]
MTTIRLVTDSTSDLTPEEIEKYSISVVPLNISIDEHHYVDGVTISKEEFIKQMRQSANLPKTAQPAIGKFVEVYDELGKEATHIISIHLMKSISGTVDSARQAADITEASVTVIDSQFTSRSMGQIVLEAAKAIDEGKSYEEVLDVINKAIENTILYLTVLELDNLIKGGRISRLMGAFSNLLNIKLFLQVINGQIEIIQKGRGLKSLQKKYDQVFQEMLEVPQGIKAISIMHAGLNEFNQANIDILRKLFPNVPLTVVVTSPIIMSHTGENAMALTYLMNE